MPADPLTAPAIEPPAFYGKLPSHGDFVARGLSAEQEAAIDRWLASWMAAARAEWDDAFEAHYRDAQPWLFGGERLSAIAIPSADRAGRLFPLLAAVGAGEEIQPIYDTVVAAIAEEWDGDRLIGALEALPKAASGPAPQGWFVPDPGERAMPNPLELAEAAPVEAMLA